MYSRVLWAAVGLVRTCTSCKFVLLIVVSACVHQRATYRLRQCVWQQLFGFQWHSAMSFSWPDPPCPIVGVDGAVPTWLSLQAFPGGGRNWYCRLCDQWADTNHLSGRRHQNRLCVLSQRQCSAMLSPGAVAAGHLETSHGEPEFVQFHHRTSASTGGLPLGIGLTCSSFAEPPPMMIVPQDCPSVSQITSTSQFAPSVLEELFVLAQSRLGKLSAGSAQSSGTSSASTCGMASDVTPTC